MYNEKQKVSDTLAYDAGKDRGQRSAGKNAESSLFCVSVSWMQVTTMLSNLR